MAAKIDALASQINPHFLFNTLTSISSLIRTQPETARTVVSPPLGAAPPAPERSTEPLRDASARSSNRVNESLRHRVIRFGPQAAT